jgi:LytR cell envelope-related transcriptional attenuator
MGPVNLSPARVAVLVALVVAGVAVMLNGFDDGGSAVAGGTDVVSPSGSDVAEPTESSSPSVSQSPEPELEPQVEGVSIQVLNGTEATGLAAEADAFLIGKGYEQGLTPGDLATKPVPGTTVYFRTGPDADQNRVDAENLATRFLEGVEATVKPLNDALDAEVAPKTQLVVVLGDDYAAAHPVV